MKIDIKEADVESNITFGDTIEMGISQDGIQHLMSTLTNLYNDPQLAVIREYYTNGLDSHVEAGQTQPVDVYLPTRDNPMYVVRDYGIGMSVDDIKTIYSKYGASTKRGTNTQVGAYGLGCKSALTDAEQFTLTAVKNGKKVTAIIGKSEKGTNTIDLLPEREVDEGNGVTVTIPVKEVSSFNSKAIEFFKYSDPAKVRVNGHAPESVLASADLLYTDADSLKIYTQHYNGWRNPTFKVIMGDVPYEFSTEEAEESVRRIGTTFDIGLSKLNAFFVVGIGDVDLTPSREGLRYTDKTKALVDKVFGLYIEKIRETAYAEIDAVTERHLVYAVVDKWDNILDASNTKWKGEDILRDYKHDKYFNTVKRIGQDSTHGTSSVLNLRNQYYVVYGRPDAKYKSVSMYLTPWMTSKDLGRATFYFTEDISKMTSKWITENKNITFIKADDLVAEAKIQRKKERDELKGQLAKSNKYAYTVLDLITHKLEKIPYDLLPENTPYLNISSFYNSLEGYYSKYFNGRGSVDSQYGTDIAKNKEVAEALAKFTKATKVVLIGGNLKPEAYLNRVKGSYSVVKDIDATVTATFANVPQNVRDIAALKGTELGNFAQKVKKAQLESGIKDRELRRLINPTKKARLTYEKLISYEKTLDVIMPSSGMSRKGKIPVHSDLVVEVSGRYPLLRTIYSSNLLGKTLEHLIIYMNAVYDASLTPAP